MPVLWHRNEAGDANKKLKIMADFDNPKAIFPDQTDESDDEISKLHEKLLQQEKKIKELAEKIGSENEIKEENAKLTENIEELNRNIAFLEAQNKRQKAEFEQNLKILEASKNEDKTRVEEMRKNEENYKVKIDNLQKENSKINQKLKETNSSLETMKNEVSHFLKSVDNNEVFESLDAVLLFIKNRKETKKENGEENTKIEESGVQESLRSEITKLKQQLIKAKNEKDESKANDEETISELQQKIEQMKYEAEAKEIDFNQEINTLNDDKEELEQQLKEATSNANILQKRVKELENANEECMLNISKLNSISHEQEKKNRKMKIKVGMLKDALRQSFEQHENSVKINEETMLQNDEYANTIDSLDIKLKEKNDQNNEMILEMSKQVTVIKKLKAEREENKRTINDLTINNNELSKQLEQIKDQQDTLIQENTILKEHKDASKSQIELKNKRIKELEDELNATKTEMMNELSKTKTELEETKKQQESEATLFNESQILPPQIWMVDSFPEYLQEKIRQTGENSFMKPPEQIASVMSILSKSIKEHENENIEKDKTIQESNAKEAILKQLFSETSSLIKEREPLDNIASDEEKASEYINSVKSRIESMNNTVAAFQHQSTLLNTVSNLLKVNAPSEVPKSIKALLEQNAKAESDILSLKEELKTAVEEQKEFENQFEQYKEKIKGKIDVVNEKLKEANEKYGEKCKENQKNALELQNLKTKMESLKKLNETKIKDAEEKFNNDIKEEKNKNEIARKKLNDELIEKEKTINKLQALLEKSIMKYKKARALLEEKTERFNQDLKEAERIYKEKSEADQRNATEDIQELHDLFDNVTATLKLKNENAENKLNDANKTISTQKQTISTLSDNIRNIEEENEKLKTSISKAKKMYSFKIKAAETSFNTEKIELQNSLTNERVKLQKEADDKVRNICSSIALQFVDFCDAKMKIDEQNCISIVKRVHQKLDELKNQEMMIRIALGISPNESIESEIKRLRK